MFSGSQSVSTTNPQPAPAFAHAAEAEFARMLDFYGLIWEYEPRTFVLREDKEGRPVVAFTPDFYLPDQDLYVEITTIKPRQVKRKNRKIRWLLEHYPEINIKLFKRSDFRQLMAKYGLDDDQRAAWIGLDSQGEEDEEDTTTDGRQRMARSGPASQGTDDADDTTANDRQRMARSGPASQGTDDADDTTANDRQRMARSGPGSQDTDDDDD